MIANTFFRAGYIESWGRGIQKIQESCKENGNKMAEYRVSASEIMVVFYGAYIKTNIYYSDENTQENTQDEIKNTQDERKNTQDEIKNTQDERKNTQDETKNTQDNIQKSTFADRAMRILIICKEPKSKQEIVQLLGYKTIKSVKTEMDELLKLGRLTMTIPDKPNSKKQKYVTVRQMQPET